MPRVIKEHEYMARRSDILDAVQRLVYSKGFDQMTIQDILDDLHISKGAFYHYFKSKEEVLGALVERMVNEIEPSLIAIVQNPNLTALEKLHGFFDDAMRWKTGRKTLMLSLLRAWYADANAVLRQKVFSTTVHRLTPWMTRIIHQGIQEGAFVTSHPEYFCQMSLYLMQGLGDEMVALLLTDHADGNPFQRAQLAVDAYTAAFERILGASPATVQLIDLNLLKEWFV